ncbi:YjbH domain-containing protein [Amphibiibacter pelophylacis]|uniref:YjbH domain-containing protein n=1 Tax=Amphibiibacter pelophylacis TaxID=1799477 RepID=A0ACC6P2A9_9BURK
MIRSSSPLLRPARLALACALACTAVLPLSAAHAAPSSTGVTGLINMPTADVEPGGNWRWGYSRFGPYSTAYSTVSLFDRLEVNGRFTTIKGVAGFEGNAAYGDYKDKSIDVKLRLLDENDWRPAVAVGVQDIFGTEIFHARYIAASKSLALPAGLTLRGTLGYGQDRIGGVFGGLDLSAAAWPGWRLMLERDTTRFENDPNAAQSGAARIHGRQRVGVGYRWGWIDAQITRSASAADWGGGLSLNIPLGQKTFVPWVNEPAPFAAPDTPRPTEAQWDSELKWSRDMASALQDAGFKNLRLAREGDVLRAQLASTRISDDNRSAGRAARIIMTFAPAQTRLIDLTLTRNDLVLTRVSIPFDAAVVAQLEGKAPAPQQSDDAAQRRAAVAAGQTLASDYARPQDDLPTGAGGAAVQQGLKEAGVRRETALDNSEGDLIAFRTESSDLGRLKITPRLDLFLNDPSGFLRYDLGLAASFSQRLAQRTFVEAGATLSLHETVSGVTQPSDSQLPHVRSDVADYKRDGRFKLDRLLVNHYLQPLPQVYGRVSAGLYEEMFAGAGTQWLYQPAYQPWTLDLAVDALRQRDTQGLLGFRPYRTVTAVASLHYRLPLGVTATVRAGRFLARDTAARFELKRRFASGVEVGGWYTLSRAYDVLGGKRYQDKGVFVRWPLSNLLGKDTQVAIQGSLSPWTRDIGQLVRSPSDLYDLVEKPLTQDLADPRGLEAFAQ